MSKNIEKQYLKLLKDILENGVEKQDRTGTGTISVFGRQIRHDMSKGFPLLTTKKMYWKGIIGELLWFLKGSTDIRDLWKNDIKIWDGDWYKKYEKSCSSPYTLEEIKQKVIKGAHTFHDSMFDLGPIYGKQWRHWGGNIKRLTYGFIDKNDDGWVMRWSDLHSFGAGSHWCYTPIKNSNTINDSDIGKRVVFGFEADHEDFNPLKYAIINTDTKDEYENHVDQIQNLINDLKTTPDSRRLMVNTWNVGELDQMTLPPCHYGFQIYTRELSSEERAEYFKKYPESWPDNESSRVPKRAISLMWNQRSVDTFLGLPFNIASYGLLLEIIAREVNMVPDELVGNLGDVHLYKNHIEQAKEQMTRKKMELPKLTIEDEVKWAEGDCLPYYSPSDFTLENYQSHPPIKAPLSN